MVPQASPWCRLRWSRTIPLSTTTSCACMEKVPAIAQRYWAKVVTTSKRCRRRSGQSSVEQSESSAAIVRSDELIRQCNQSTLSSHSWRLSWQLPVQLSRYLEMPLSELERNDLGMRETQLARSKVLAGDRGAVLAIDDITTMVVLRTT